jgi:hypothetical protein
MTTDEMIHTMVGGYTDFNADAICQLTEPKLYLWNDEQVNCDSDLMFIRTMFDVSISGNDLTVLYTDQAFDEPQLKSCICLKDSEGTSQCSG